MFQDIAPGTAAITGHSSGLGWCITNALLALGWQVYGMSAHEGRAEGVARPAHYVPAMLFDFQGDVRWKDECEAFAGMIDGPLDVLINCAGINCLVPFDQLMGDMWESVMDTNAKAPWLVTQALLGHLARSNDRPEGGTVLNIVSNASRVPMTHSLAYNASKAAAAMVTRQMARELFKSHGLTVFSISPNKLRGTAMSRQIEAAVPELRGWTPEEAEAYQRAALPTGEETEPDTLAEFVAFLLSDKQRHRYLHGCDIPYGG